MNDPETFAQLAFAWTPLGPRRRRAREAALIVASNPYYAAAEIARIQRAIWRIAAS